MIWQVGCHLGFDVVDDATFALQVSPATGVGTVARERIDVAVDGRPLPVTRLDGDHGGVIQMFRCPPGSLTIEAETTITGVARHEPAPATGPPVLGVEQLTYLRQSRYCPSDLLSGFAAYELGHLRPGPELLVAVGDWVASRLTYQEGSSGPLSTAVDSMFAGQGVCRDFAHLAITVLRALEVPARLVAVYAPGLSPMEFHAVAEAHVDGAWRVLDATRLAPRPALLRVSTGRDAADTAFVTVLGGRADLTANEVIAVTDGDLPDDDHIGVVSIA